MSATIHPMNHLPQSPPDADPADNALTLAAKRCGDLSRQLSVELLLDAQAVRMGEALTLDEIADLARRTAHEANILLPLFSRVCPRCGDPLMTWADRQAGQCEACRENRRAVRAIGAGRQA